MINNLAALHLEDLKRSGLSDSIIEQADIKSVPPNDIRRKIGFDIPGLISCYEILYDKTFSRFRAFYDENNNGKEPKYIQRKDSGNRLYIPSTVRPILNDSSIPLYITEGEKKALKATQEGLFCIGLSGLWNWSNGKKELIPDFDLLTLAGRRVYIVPDNDWLQPNKHGYRKNLKQAVYLLADRLKQREARVFIVELPQGEEKGLDDYLCNHTVEEFQALPLIEVKSLSERIVETTPENVKEFIKEIEQIQSETERAILIEKLAKKLKISKRAIQKDIQHNKPYAKDELKAIISAKNIPGLVDLALDETGAVVYLIKNRDVLEVATIYEQDEVSYSPPDKQQLPFELARAADVINWYRTDHDKKLFEDVIAYLKRFSCLPDNQFLIVACKVFLTYIQDHTDIHYMPMILFYAVPERGKSRTGKAVVYISYRGIHVVDLREANLFRFSENLKATLFFDLMDLWKKAERNGSEDILLSRFEKGARATRVQYPEKGAFNDTVYYEVYGPTIIATNEPLHKILDTRGINITMPNKPGNYENPTPDKGREIKERLTAWRARVQDASLPAIEPIHGIQGRLWDISQPLLKVCKIVYPEGFDSLKNALFEVAGHRIEDKKASIEGQIVTILHELSPEGIPEWTIKTSELLTRLNKSRPEEHQLKSQYLGRKLNAIGLQTKIVMGYSWIQLDIETFNILLTQHGLENISLPASVETLLNSTNPLKQAKSMSCGSGELKESDRYSNETLLIQSLDDSGSMGLVGSSRELTGDSKKTFQASSLKVLK
jgi:hypothetical protein